MEGGDYDGCERTCFQFRLLQCTSLMATPDRGWTVTVTLRAMTTCCFPNYLMLQQSGQSTGFEDGRRLEPPDRKQHV